MSPVTSLATRLRARLPPPFYALATGAVIWAVSHYLPRLPALGAPWSRYAWILVVAGVSLDVYAIGSFFFKKTTVDPTHPGRASHLVVSGVYSMSRNPMYLGLVLSLAGWTLLVSTPLCLPLVWGFACLIQAVQIAPEEAALRARFGDAYGDYTQRVNRWLGRKSPLAQAASSSSNVRR
jgi:protein-S-isoprenylcysteine O-methyltransferase Ste14